VGGVLVRKDVPVEMRDQVADLFPPGRGGQHPVLLQRTAYDKTSQTASSMLNPVRAASEGYAVVVQDSRGRYTSEGDFDPFFCEINDGYDTVEWCAAQGWSNGDIGMYGMSYVGATQWLAAISSPPHLRAIFPVMTAADYFDGWVYQGGTFYLAFTSAWAAQFLAAPQLSRMGLKPQERAAEERRLMLSVERLRRHVSHLPLSELPMLKPDGLAPYFYEWLRHPCRDDYWKDHHRCTTTR
jgi:putative CocE/NonD family hydrolase